MKKSTIALSVLLIPFTLLTGCASIVNGTHQVVTVNTDPVTQASCDLSNSKGHWHVSGTPGSVRIHRAYGNLSVLCRKPGYSKGQTTVESHTKGMAFGNAVFGGLVGAGVDTADGAAFAYPDTIFVRMNKVHM